MGGSHAGIHDIVATRLCHARQRYSDPRRSLVDVLLGAARPITVPEKVEAGADQAQSSLYRNIAIFEQCGIVRRLVYVHDIARYQLDEDSPATT